MVVCPGESEALGGIDSQAVDGRIGMSGEGDERLAVRTVEDDDVVFRQ